MVLGIDEVGRGCWAGPLVAGAVMLPDDFVVPLADSKALSAARRQVIYNKLLQANIRYGLGWVTPSEVDALGLTEAVRLAMQRALTALDAEHLEIIIDGNYNFLPELPNVQTLVKADALIPSVSAASILAKVARDTYMQQLALQYPEYGFEKHVGYGTALHRAALQRYGVTPEHRRSYKPIRALLQ